MVDYLMMVGNTFFDQPEEKLVTYLAWGAHRFDKISHRDFAQLDHVFGAE